MTKDELRESFSIAETGRLNARADVRYLLGLLANYPAVSERMKRIRAEYKEA